MLVLFDARAGRPVRSRLLHLTLFIPFATLFGALLTACGPTATPDPFGLTGRLVLYSGRREALIQPLVDQFTALHPEIEVVRKTGDNVELANALLEEASRPQADAFLATEVLTVERLFQDGALDRYTSPFAAVIPVAYRQPDGGWTPLTLRARVIMYNTDQVAAGDAPTSILHLTDPAWEGRVAAAGSTNGSLQAQVAVMRQLLGDAATEAWLRGLLDNGVTFFGGHTDVRKAVGAGEFALGLVNHYYYHLQAEEGSPVGVIYPDQGPGQMGVIVNATAIGLVRGAAHPAAARAWIDYLLSEGQQLFAELNFEYPVDPAVSLHPDVLPLDEFRVARFDLAQAVAEMDATFDLIERVRIP